MNIWLDPVRSRQLAAQVQVMSFPQRQAFLIQHGLALRSARDPNYSGTTPRDPHGKWVAGTSKQYPEVAPVNHAWFQKAGGHPVTESERDAVSWYTGSGHRLINDELRQAKGDITKLANPHTAKNLDQVVARGATQENATVYRGFRMNSKEYDAAVPGHSKFVDHGFISTSMDESMGRTFAASYSGSKVLMEIQVPKGTHFAVGTSFEKELILPRGSSFSVIGKSSTYGSYGPLRVLTVRLRQPKTRSASRDSNYTGNVPRDEHGKWTGAGGYPTLQSVDAMHAFGEAGGQAGPMSDDEITTVRSYVEDGYRSINEQLRDSQGDAEQVNSWTARDVANLDSVMEMSNGTPEDVTVYRNFGHSTDQLVPGASFVDHGFISTSLDPKVGASFPGSVHAQIQVPKGTPFIYAAAEREVILPRSSKFTVISSETRGEGLNVVMRLEN